jgi:hypothetical protein
VEVWWCAGVVGQCGRHVKAGGRRAEHAHAADRFAREIIAILTVLVMRSRRLMGKPFGVRGKVIAIPFLDLDVENRACLTPVVPASSCRGPWWWCGTKAWCADCSLCRAWEEGPLC